MKDRAKGNLGERRRRSRFGEGEQWLFWKVHGRVPDKAGEADGELIKEDLRGVCKVRQRENCGESRGIMKQGGKHTSSNNQKELKRTYCSHTR